MLVEEGKIVDGKVSGITNFGAFIQLPEGKTGLVHISEVAEEYVTDIRTHLTENQEVKVKILSIEPSGKISLSIRKVLPKKTFNNKKVIEENKNKQSDSISFEDRLAKFMKDSDEKLHDLKRNFDSKRGSGGYRRSSQK